MMHKDKHNEVGLIYSFVVGSVFFLQVNKEYLKNNGIVMLGFN
jgi:hypothetical protein